MGIFGNKNKEPLTEEEKRKKAINTYAQAVPFVTKAYENDPRTQIAANLLRQGQNFAPTTGGVGEGLARLGSGILGGIVGNKQRDKYKDIDQYYAGKEAGALADPLAQAVGQATTPAPAAVDPMVAAHATAPMASPPPPDPASLVAGAMAGPGQAGPPQPQAKFAPGAPPVPPAPGMPPGAPPMAPAPGMPPGAPEMALGGPPAGPGPMAPPPPPQAPVAPPRARRAAVQNPIVGPTPNTEGGAVDPAQLFHQAIIPIEGGTDRQGRFRTSPKGAVGPAQVMPGTAPEAARLAGLPWDERKYRGDAAYNTALGEAYYKEMYRQFGDPAVAAAAYNAGPGATRRALRRWNASGQQGDFTDYFPKGNTETPKYVANFRNAAGGTGGSPESINASNYPSLPREQETELPPEAAPVVQPQLQDRVRSARLQVAQRLLSSDPEDAAGMLALSRPYLDEGWKEDQESKMARDKDLSQMAYLGYQMDLSKRNAQDQARYGAQVDEYGDTREFNRKMRELEWTKKYGTAEEQAQAARDQQYELDQIAAEERKAIATENARAENYGTKYFYTQGGQKQRTEIAGNIASADKVIDATMRVDALVNQMSTGGVTNRIQWTNSYNAAKSELTALRNDLVLNKMGGRLGAAISDADRDFVTQGTPVGPEQKPEVIRETARRLRVLAKRTKDYEVAHRRAINAGPEEMDKFDDDFERYKREVPLARGGRMIGDKDYITFDEWKAAQ